jgi:hypothetical protein
MTASEGEEELLAVEEVAGENPEPSAPQIHGQQLRMAPYMKQVDQFYRINFSSRISIEVAKNCKTVLGIRIRFQRYGSGSFYHQAIIVRKPLIPNVL